MRVTDIINILKKNYKDDDEIAFAFWDKNLIEERLDMALSEAEWPLIAERIEEEADVSMETLDKIVNSII